MDLEDLSSGESVNYSGTELPFHYQEKGMSEYVYRGAASRICKVNPKTWDKYVENRYIEPDGKDPLGHIYFKRSKVVAFAKTLRKDRKPGLPLLMKETPRKNAK